MGEYARGTSVSVEKSVSEIQSTLRRYGATKFMYGEEENRAVLMFEVMERRIRFLIELPDREEFRYTENAGRERSDSQTFKAWESECRRRWRALALVVKAKLEAVQSGMVVFEDEFLAYIVMPDDRTVGDHIRPRLQGIYESGQMRPLLPAPGETS